MKEKVPPMIATKPDSGLVIFLLVGNPVQDLKSCTRLVQPNRGRLTNFLAQSRSRKKVFRGQLVQHTLTRANKGWSCES